MKFLLRVSVICLTLLLTACIFDSPSSPSEAPANVTVTEGESLVVLDWDVEPGLTYWVFYKQGTSAGVDDYDNILTNAVAPFMVPNLVNGTQYAFAMTSSQDGSKVGPFSPAVIGTPRLLGPTIGWKDDALALTTQNLLSIAFGNNIYVTVGNAASVFAAPFSYTSPGGVTGWSPATTLPAGLTNLTSVIHDGASFIALGDNGSIIRSTDGLTWEAATAIAGPPATMNALTVGAGAYVAVGNSGEIYTNTTADISAAWTLQTQTSGTTENLYGVSYLNGKFIAVGASGVLLTSTDAIIWTRQTSNAGANTLRQVAYGAGTYVAVGNADVIVSSTDAITWELPHADPTIGAESFHAITFGPDAQFIAVGTVGTIIYSTTGADGSWAETQAKAGSKNLNSIAPSAVFIAVGDNGANVSGK